MQYYAENKSEVISGRLYRQHGITTEDKLKLLESKGGKCAICGTTNPGKNWALDHCHRTQVIRGVLCDACNKGLGFFKDNVSSLQNAIWYVLLAGRKPPESVCIENVPMPDEELEWELEESVE